MTAYLEGVEYYNNVHEKRYGLNDDWEFKINGEKYTKDEIILCYNLNDNVCCVNISNTQNGKLEYLTVKCISVSPMDIASDEMDQSVIKRVLNSKVLVLSQKPNEEIDLEWD